MIKAVFLRNAVYRAGPVLLVLMACWHTAPLAWERWFSAYGNPIGAAIFAVAVAEWLLHLYQSALEQDRVIYSARWLAAAAGFLLVHAACAGRTPDLIVCNLAALSLGCAMMAGLPPKVRRGFLGLFVLLPFSMSLGPSLDFYLGYPLRALVGQLTALALGQGIRPVGTGLSDGVHTVFIDAPCSGIRMLSTALVFAGALAMRLRLTPLRTALIVASAVLLAIAGNTWRAAALFLIETHTRLGERVHVAIGIAVFCICLAALAWLAMRLHAPAQRASTSEPANDPPHGPVRQSRRVGFAAFLCACVAAASAPVVILERADSAHANIETAIVWPRSWNGVVLVPAPLDAKTEAFRQSLAGAIRQFRLGDSGLLVLLRYCGEATRRLHPAEDCYRATGWTCSPLPALRDERGNLWSRFRAQHRDGTVRTVRQCYVAVSGQQGQADLAEMLTNARSWPDVSSWYWDAARPGSNVRMTLAITVAE